MAADEIQIRYQNCLQKHLVPCGDETAFSPSLGGIGFIDEDDDDLTSDMSEASYSEEKKQSADQEEPIGTTVLLTNETDPSFPNHTQCQTVTEDITSQNEPHDAVPSRQVAQVLHSNQSIPFEDELSDYQNALQKTACVQENYEDSTVILNGPTNEDLNYETLEQSMATLKASLADKSALSTFEKLARCRQGATMNVAKLQENMIKNRYKDVLPYDESRVILKDPVNNDYINASYVQMKIPPLWTKNEYIATQGPLPHTSNDFWQMVWEQKSQIIIMVTTLKERNRVKCHKYWPDLYEVVTFGYMQITCFRETITGVAITRDILVINDKTNEERHIVQLQHVKWPDHGVPQDASDFVAFVQHLRTLKNNMEGPVIVHCSAGVGRTGVFILMETALSYIEASRPLYPHDLVGLLRDQRVMMVQTVSQFKFICEAILKVYGDIQGTLNGAKHSFSISQLSIMIPSS